MYQSFEDEAQAQHSAKRIKALRSAFNRHGIKGYIVPRTDEYQGEYVAAYAERLQWLTGFSGSAGLAIILEDEATIFVDGRYTIQVREQTDTSVISAKHLIDEPPARWIASTLKQGDVLGYDPWLLTAAQVDRFTKACAKAGAELCAINGNLIDDIWTDQPARPAGPATVHPTQFAGRSATDKLSELGQGLKESGAAACVLTMPESVAWLFNIRGQDVAHTPIAHAMAIFRADSTADIFIEEERLAEDVMAHLSGFATIRPPSEFTEALSQFDGDAAVQVDQSTAPQIVKTLIEGSGAKPINRPDPCALPRARKNQTEQEGARAAHRRDGAAMVNFLSWLDRTASEGDVSEITAAQKLEECRHQTGQLRDISFDTISAAGPHAAIPHYRVTVETNLPLESGRIFLVDSGGQYMDGTTDITRTVIVGDPSDEMRDRFTRVLKGMIALSRVRFPEGTTGGNLDVLARAALWASGLDFDHGTGHGVGSYLSVHEGPARFSKADSTKLEPGMILSNEPGYYKDGDFGIRIENLLLVREAEPISGGERDMHWFETLVLCPIDRRLIDAKLLDDDELDWLNSYHGRVLSEIGPLVEGDALAWLEAACEAITR